MEDKGKTYTLAVYLDGNAPNALPLAGARLPAFQWASPAPGGLWFPVDEVPVLKGGVDTAQLYVVDADRIYPEDAEIVVTWKNGQSPFPPGERAPLLTYKSADRDAPGMKDFPPPQTFSSTPALVVNDNTSSRRFSFSIQTSHDGSTELPIFYLDPEMVVEPGG